MTDAPLLSPNELKRIAVIASSLWERIDRGAAHDVPPRMQKKITSRLKEWRNVVSEGNQAKFARRLAYDRLDAKIARALLGRTKIPLAFELPEWCAVLNEVLRKAPALRDAAVSRGRDGNFTFLRNDAPVPFEELFLPFIEVAREKLGTEGAAEPSVLPDKMRGKFERALLTNLSQIAARVLMVEFRAFLACRQFSGLPYTSVEEGKTSRSEYLNFVTKTYAEGWAPLFEEYCVMARLLATALLQWVETVREFRKRLRQDLPEIEKVFNSGNPTGAVTAIESGLSDPHDGGRTVISIEFACGLKLIYKPKCLALEHEYFRFTAWLNGLEALPPFRLLTILNRGAYGWVEFVENRPCATEDDVQRYYRRAGIFLCIVYVLGGIDFHYENLIADGEHPVPIDLETIYHHHADNPFADKKPLDELAERLQNSVLATDFLPDPVKMNHQYFDISAVARSVEEEGEFEVLTWKHINTDGVDYDYEKGKPQAGANLPLLGNKAVSPDEYTGQIVKGFREAYRFLLDNKDELLADDGPLRQLFVHDARFVFRSTVFYTSVLKSVFHPDYLRDGIDISLQMDILARSLIKAGIKPRIWPLIRMETDSLWRMDVPKFTARGDGNSLTLKSGKVVAGCFVDSAWNRVQLKIRDLSEADLRWQVILINGSMDVRAANRQMDYTFTTTTSGKNESSPPSGREELLENALCIAREIEAKAFRSNNGEPGWMVLNYSPEAKQFALRAMEYDLYNGRAGVALFFAALEKVLPGSGFHGLVHATLAPIRRWIGNATERELAQFGFSGYCGLTSIVYAFTRAGRFLSDCNLIADARRTALRITQQQIDEDETLDAISGSAGVILGLLACHTATGDSEILATAAACGRHLLQKRKADGSGFRTWPTVDKRNLTGFAHGAAGITYALLRLHAETGERNFYDAAQEGIDFERHEFVLDQNTWPAHRGNSGDPPQRPRSGMTWCHGVPGIALGRIGALDAMDTPGVRSDIDDALGLTGDFGLLPRDHLCCGNAGLMDTLCTGGMRLSRRKWMTEALRLAARTTARARRNGAFAVAFKNGFFNPSLFQGIAGVGYQMLRLASPDEISSVLLLE